MIHPIYMTALRRPDLVAAHLRNHVELVKKELGDAGRSVVYKAAGAIVALVALLLALGLTGISLMLGALQGYHWALVAVPGAAWLLTAIGAVVAMKASVRDDVQEVKDELEADFAVLRTVKEARRG
jgi:Putative Actinobacterial Holin-X, holin superfamily III